MLSRLRGSADFLRCVPVVDPLAQRTLIKLIPEEIGALLLYLTIHLHQLLCHIAHFTHILTALF